MERKNDRPISNSIELKGDFGRDEQQLQSYDINPLYHAKDSPALQAMMKAEAEEGVI
jgi:hypothetical protein